jgi:predicted ThiF/HesA family dinucleotide-utilizing enzyme
VFAADPVCFRVVRHPSLHRVEHDPLLLDRANLVFLMAHGRWVVAVVVAPGDVVPVAAFLVARLQRVHDAKKLFQRPSPVVSRSA